MKWIDYITNHTSEELQKIPSSEIALHHHEGWVEEAVLAVTEPINIMEFEFFVSDSEEPSISTISKDKLNVIAKEVAEKCYVELYHDVILELVKGRRDYDTLNSFNSDILEEDVLNIIYRTIERDYLPSAE